MTDIAIYSSVLLDKKHKMTCGLKDKRKHKGKDMTGGDNDGIDRG